MVRWPTWGENRLDFERYSDVKLMRAGVQAIVGNGGGSGAFAAVQVDGSVVTWGVSYCGGDSSNVAAQLSGGVQTVVANAGAFAAVKVDGSVVTWGEAHCGGDSRMYVTAENGGPCLAAQLSGCTDCWCDNRDRHHSDGSLDGN